MLDLTRVGEERRRWIALGGQLAGVDVEIRHAGPKVQEKFRQRMVRAGIVKQADGAVNINSGREDDFFKAYAEQYITDWRGEITPEGTPYSAEKMGAILGAYSVAFEQVSRALAEEADFFSANGSGSTA